MLARVPWPSLRGDLPRASEKCCVQGLLGSPQVEPRARTLWIAGEGFFQSRATCRHVQMPWPGSGFSRSSLARPRRWLQSELAGGPRRSLEVPVMSAELQCHSDAELLHGSSDDADRPTQRQPLFARKLTHSVVLAVSCGAILALASLGVASHWSGQSGSRASVRIRGATNLDDLGNLVDDVKDAADDAVDEAQDAADDVVEKPPGGDVAEDADEVVDDAQDDADDVAKDADKVVDNAQDAADDVAEKLPGGDVADDADEVVDDAQEDADDVAEDADKAVDDAQDAADDVADKLPGGDVAKDADEAVDDAQDDADDVAEDADKVVDNAQDAADDVAEKLPGGDVAEDADEVVDDAQMMRMTSRRMRTRSSTMPKMLRMTSRRSCPVVTPKVMRMTSQRSCWVVTTLRLRRRRRRSCVSTSSSGAGDGSWRSP
ncbi:unnamed protein product [Prorocentrum cordatum]|uniref:Uncharacterized protein n=1 Tax=Prorocentrum cordatum TaxID=2364126 RepID=A0ABN9TVA7_9DINO|nr:unnamed protein product [Polarella glacialis]